MRKLLLLGVYFISFCIGNSYAQSCTANFGYVENGLTINFIDSSSSSTRAHTYSWDVLDTPFRNYTSPNPRHTFSTAGTYLVCLTITDTVCTDSMCKYIEVNNTSNYCTADFTYWVDSLNNVDFTSYANAFGSSYSWDFGDGTTDSSANPTHKYANPGAYGVSLTVISSGDTCDYLDTIYVNECFLTVNIDTINTGTQFTRVNYTIDSYYVDLWKRGGLSQGNVIFSWDHGNGTTTTGNSPNVSWGAYTSSGTFNVCHTQHDTLTNNICSYKDTISINVGCQAGFATEINNDTVKFINTGFYASSISYNFGDGNSSNQENPTHMYDSSGTYIVCQIVTDSIKNCSSEICDTISVEVPPPPCNAGFTYQVKNDTVVFTNTASYYDSLFYDFGDGIASNTENPTHIYDTSGSYTVCQTVFDTRSNCQSVHCETINVTLPPPCKAGFTYTQNGDSSVFTNTASSYNRIVYDFGDGSSSTEENPYHIYNKSGTYIINQTVYNDARNCVDSISDTISVSISTSCFATYSVAIDTNKKELLYLINFSSNHPNHEYFWTFGDGNTGSGRTPSNLYTDYGKYEICLTVSDSVLDCMSTYCDSVGLDSNSQVLKANGFTLQVIDGEPIGIEENSLESELTLYPNPFSDILNINLSENQNTIFYQVFDINGRVLVENQFAGPTHQINLGQLNRGIFLIQFSDGKNVLIKRIIKK